MKPQISEHLLHWKPRGRASEEEALCTPLRTLWNTNLSISTMAKTKGAHTASPSTRNPRPRASLMRDFTSVAPQALAIPPSKGGVQSSPPQRRYETSRPPTTPGASTSCPKKSLCCPHAKKS